MPLTKPATISRSVRVGKFTGVGFLVVPTSRGEVKMYHGDHLVEVDYTRPARSWEPGYISNPGPAGQKQIQKTHVFVVPEDCARGMSIYLPETVEAETARLAIEAEAKQREAAAKAEATEAAEAAKKAAEVKK